MSSHSPEFKAKVALEAISQRNDAFAVIAKKYDVSADDVEKWINELHNNAAEVFESASSQGEVTDVEIQSDSDEFVNSVSYGAEGDGLDYSALFKWSGIGVVSVVVFIVALIFYSQFALDNAKENVNVTSAYYEIQQLNEEAETILNSFGVVDLEEGVYRIPIDEAINKLATD